MSRPGTAEPMYEPLMVRSSATRWTGETGQHGVRRAERASDVELVLQGVDGDDVARTGGERRQERVEAAPAETNDGHRLPEPDLRGVDDRAHARQDGAAE